MPTMDEPVFVLSKQKRNKNRSAAIPTPIDPSNSSGVVLLNRVKDKFSDSMITWFDAGDALDQGKMEYAKRPFPIKRIIYSFALLSLAVSASLYFI